VKLTSEDYQRHYRTLSDGELLDIDRRELVDAARVAYDHEIDRRGLATPTIERPDRIEEYGVVGELVEAGVFSSLEEANVARGILESAEIPVELDRGSARVTGPATPGSLRLMVPASCVEEARDLLEPFHEDANKAAVQRWLEQEWTPENEDLVDFSVIVEDAIADLDKVAARFKVDARRPGSREKVGWTGVAMARVKDGQIVESWVGRL